MASRKNANASHLINLKSSLNCPLFKGASTIMHISSRCWPKSEMAIKVQFKLLYPEKTNRKIGSFNTQPKFSVDFFFFFLLFSRAVTVNNTAIKSKHAGCWLIQQE